MASPHLVTLYMQLILKHSLGMEPCLSAEDLQQPLEFFVVVSLPHFKCCEQILKTTRQNEEQGRPLGKWRWRVILILTKFDLD